MELLIVWAVSIGIAKIMKLLMTSIIVKDVAASGYKIKYDNINEIQEGLKDLMYQQKLFDYVPLLNILYVLKASMEYTQRREDTIDQLSVLGIIEPMTNEEQDMYDEHPTFLTALTLALPEEKRNDIINSRKKEKSIYSPLEDKDVIIDISIEKISDKEIIINMKNILNETYFVRLDDNCNILEEKGIYVDLELKDKIKLIQTVLIVKMSSDKNMSMEEIIAEIDSSVDEIISKKENISEEQNTTEELIEDNSEEEYQLKRKK